MEIFAKFINVIRDTHQVQPVLYIVSTVTSRGDDNRMWKNDKIENLFESMKILFCGDIIPQLREGEILRFDMI